jgi:hypothetical protein
MSILALALSAGGCGKQTFRVLDSTENQSAPGTFSVPPKVDILVAQDNTGSMLSVYPQIEAQFPAFVSQLAASNWDYHLAAMPLTTDQPLSQATASQFDSNWGSSWSAPYPGAPNPGPEDLLSSIFQLPSNFTGFPSTSDDSNTLAGEEPGFDRIEKFFKNRVQGTHFLRPDAMLAILVISNGDDTSNVTYCNGVGGGTVPCDQGNAETNGTKWCGTPETPVSQCGGYQSSLTSFQQYFSSLKTASSQVSFFAAVPRSAPSNGQCLGEAYPGKGARYISMSNSLNGGTYGVDVCNPSSINTIFTALSGSLQSKLLLFHTHYLFVSQQPDPTSIVVTKYPGGDTTQGVTIAQDPNNGWSLPTTPNGYVTNVYTIDSPVPMNQASGYGIILNGSAELVGNDTASVTFKPYIAGQ